MDEIVNEKKDSKFTHLEFIQGNVFNAKSLGADGVFVFYYGLSAIRTIARKYQMDEQFNAAFRLTRYIDIDKDENDWVENTEDMQLVLDSLLDEAMDNNCSIIAMNGIRARIRPDDHVRSEKYQIQFIKEWLDLHPGVFEKIYLIDRRGGFNRADEKI